MNSFWQALSRPFFVLAPLADVTDPAFRRLIAETGMPDALWTEFVSADGLYHTREMKKMADEENPLMRDLQFSKNEKPIVAQLFSSKPEMMSYAAELVAKLGFDGVDINMGCPDRAIERQGCGSAMIKTPKIAQEIIKAAREGAARGKEGGLPVSVKTRIGYNTETMDEWLPAVLEAAPDALTIHLRTRKEMSAVPAHWDLMAKAVEIRNKVRPETLILGNGDVRDLADAKQKIAETGADGIMFGRAIFGNPWLFTDRDPATITQQEKLQALLTLARYFDGLRPQKSFHILKKHLKAFVSGFDGASELRAQLMEAADLAAFEAVLAPLLLLY